MTIQEVFAMYRVFGKNNAGGAWTPVGSYGSESSAMLSAQSAMRRYQFVRVVDPSGATIWSS